MKEIKLARQLEARYRRVRRFVESPVFQCAWKNIKGPNKDIFTLTENKVLTMINKGKIDELRQWAYLKNSLFDAPLRWLRDQASKHNIPNYSRKTKVQLVDELSGILKQSPKFNVSGTKSGRSPGAPA